MVKPCMVTVNVAAELCCQCVLIGICYENVYDLLIKVGWFLPPPSPSVCYFLWLSHFLSGLISMCCANAYNLSPKVSSFLIP
jgi:hypothetical protein